MNESIYLSRSFVEFGPFTATELQDFYKRGILKDTDYLSATPGTWVHVSEWIAAIPAPASAPKSADSAPAPAKTAPASKPAVTAKKAATKKAKK